MRVLETDRWSLLLPAEWSAEHEDGIVVIGDRDGVGCIELSEWQRDADEGEVVDLDLLARDNGLPGACWEDCRLGPFRGLYSAGEEESTFIREWYLQCGALLLYITYSCAGEHAGMDDAVVDDILQTLSAHPDLLD